MKDKRIWIVIGCILVIGTGVTHYTKYYVKNQAAAMDMVATMAGEAEAEEEAGDMPAGAPALTSLPTGDKGRGAKAGAAQAPAGRSLSSAPGAAASDSDAAVPGSTVSGLATTGSAVPGSGASGLPEATLDIAEESAAEESADGTASPGEPAAAAAQIYSEDEVPVELVPISPLTGARDVEGRSALAVDYRQRLMDLDTQIQKMREQETDSNVYSIKTSAETELKMWEGELNSIYNALLELLSKEDAAKLAAEQQEWLKNRDARAAKNTGRNAGSVERIGYAATLTSLTRDRAYELAGRYEEASGLPAMPEEETTAAVSGQ